MLWAWELSTDLRFVGAREAGVAYHFANLHLDKTGVSPYPRRQPLLTTPGAFLMPVVRIDFDEHVPFSTAQREAAAGMIEEALNISKAHAIQIDFDAPRSAYPFYRALLADVRRRIGPRVFLSITALESWCGAGSWMKNLPVDEIVPMAFQTNPVLPDNFAFPACQTSIGVLSAAPLPRIGGRRVFAFPGYGREGWDVEKVDHLRHMLKKRENNLS